MGAALRESSPLANQKNVFSLFWTFFHAAPVCHPGNGEAFIGDPCFLLACVAFILRDDCFAIPQDEVLRLEGCVRRGSLNTLRLPLQGTGIVSRILKRRLSLEGQGFAPDFSKRTGLHFSGTR